MHVNVATWAPEFIAVNGAGTSEAAAAAQAIKPGAVHLYDRGIFSFELLEAQIAANAFFVHRLREPGERTPKFTAESTRPLTDRDRDAGVLADSLGRMAGSEHRAAPDCTLREVAIASPDEVRRHDPAADQPPRRRSVGDRLVVSLSLASGTVLSMVERFRQLRPFDQS
jgi:hypothetical protein